MAEFTITLVVGVQTATITRTFTDVRALRFLDDLIENFPEVPDGPGTTRPMTRPEVGDAYVLKVMQGQIVWSKGLEQARLDSDVDNTATDLEGN